jgi:asparagine synthase (glutamine-hydrolysing)
MACIRLTGNYGSEVLRSMSTFKRNPPQPGLLTGDLAQRVECLGRESAEISARHPVTFAAFQEVPWNLFGCLAAGRSQMMFRTPYLDNELVALAYAAPVSARTSPDAAVRFVQRSHPTLGAIPTDRGLAGRGMAPVRRMRRLWADVSFKLDYHCSEGLPRGLAWLDDFYLWGNRLAGLAGQHKFLQYRRWLQHELSGFARERVAAVDLPFIDRRFVAGLVAAHVSGRRNFTREINLVATLGAVERQLLSAPSVLNP